MIVSVKTFIVFRTVELLSTTVSHRAKAHEDYKVEKSSYVTIKSGYNHTYINIIILNDTIPELNETFQVILENVKVVNETSDNNDRQYPIIDSEQKSVDITIERSDLPNGLLRMSLDSLSNGTNHLSILEPDQRNLPLQVHIDRMLGE